MSFAAPNSNGIIVQTGFDADLSGLQSNSGVTHTSDNAMDYYDFGNNRLQIKGTLFHDSDSELMIFQRDQNAHGAGSALQLSNPGNSWKYISAHGVSNDGHIQFTLPGHTYVVGDALRTQQITGESDESKQDRYGRINEDKWDVIAVDGDVITISALDRGDTLAGGRISPAAVYHYGMKYEGYGKTRYSLSTGIMITGQRDSNWHPDSYGMSTGSDTLFIANGGQLVCEKPMSFGGKVYWQDFVITRPMGRNAGGDPEIRSMSTGYVDRTTLNGFAIGNFKNLNQPNYVLENGSMFETLGSYYQQTLVDLDMTRNMRGYHLGADGTKDYSARRYKFLNSSEGSTLRFMWRETRGSTGQSGYIQCLRQVSPKTTDSNLNPIEGVKMYTQDTPSAYSKSAYYRNQSSISTGPVQISTSTPINVKYYDHPHSTGDVVLVKGFDHGGVNSGSKACGYRKITKIDSDNFTLQYLDGTDVPGDTGHGVNCSITNVTQSGTNVLITVDDVTGLAKNTKVYITGINGSVGNALNDTYQTIQNSGTAINTTNNTVLLTKSWSSLGTNTSYTDSGTLERAYTNNICTTFHEDQLEPITYTGTSDANGDVPTVEIITGIQGHEYPANASYAALSRGGEYDINLRNSDGYWRDRSDNKLPAYSDWNTTRFGNYYRVDYRGNGNTEQDMFTFCFCGYNQLLNSTTQSLLGTGVLNLNNVMLPDRDITDTKATADAYLEITNPERFYNRAKSYLYDNYDGELDNIVNINGTTIDVGYKDVVVTNNSGAAVFDYQKNTPGDLTGASGLTVTAVGDGTDNSNHPASNIIDDNTATALNKWAVSNPGSNSGVQITGFDSSIVTSIKLTSSDVYERDPTSYELYGSNDASNWTLINSSEIKTFSKRYQTQTSYFKNTDRYTSYKIIFPTRVDDSQQWLAVQEIELIGVTLEGTVTIKAETFTGNITTIGGTISVEDGAEIVGTYGDVSVLPYTLTNIEAGSTVQLYNVESGSEAEIANFVVGGVAGTKVTHTGTYANSLAEPGDEIRIRVTCQSGTSALLPYESFGVAQTSGISFKVNQQADTVYNTNGIDGSSTSITEDFTADYTNLQIDSTETDGVVTVQEIYAFYAYIVTTTSGIQNFFGAITPVDAMNFRINTSVVNLKIQNTTDTDTILKGGRLYRDDNTSVIDTDSTTGAGSGSFTHDTGFLLQFVGPQVESALDVAASAADMTTVKSDVQSIKSNTGLIPGLL